MLKEIFCSLFISFFVINNSSSFLNRNDKSFFEEPFEQIDLEKLEQIEKDYSSKGYFDDTFITPKENVPSFSEDYIDEEKINFYQNTSFNMKDYFKNLNEYSPINNIGSCGYVSLIQAMSYYDTFYNDSIIPEAFDRNYSSALTENEANLHSPGTLRLKYKNSDYSSYYSFCHNTQSYCFQSFLTVEKNINKGTDTENKFSFSIGAWDYNDLLKEVYQNSATVAVGVYTNKSQDSYINLIKNIIDSGNPAIVHIKKVNDGVESGHHSVVAYDYDENGIYANFGWDSNSNHSLLLGGDNKYNAIYCVATLNFKEFGHSHSNNYIINNEYICGCNLDDDIRVKNSTLLTNIPPTFYWKRNVYDNNETYHISFKKSYGDSVIFDYDTNCNQITLSYNAWKIINSNCLSKIYISLQRQSENNSYNETFSVFDRPFNLMNIKTIIPTDYGFQDAYPTDNSTKTNYKRHYLIDGFSFRTRRYRVGYIHNECIVMSCIKTNVTEAFIEYAFDVPISKIEVDLSHWRDYANEWLDKNSGVAQLHIWHKKDWWNLLDSDKWITKFDLLADSTNLSHDRNNKTTYTIEFETPVYGFRFYSKINKPRSSTSNKGRICIGNMKLYIANI